MENTTEEVMNFAEKLAVLKAENGIVSKTRETKDSKFAIVKGIFKEKNVNKAEIIFKTLTIMKEKGIEVNDKSFKQVQRLIGNYMTYVRKSYKGYESLKLIEDENHLQVVIRTE